MIVARRTICILGLVTQRVSSEPKTLVRLLAHSQREQTALVDGPCIRAGADTERDNVASDPPHMSYRLRATSSVNAPFRF
jgi:hypothetical protein